MNCYLSYTYSQITTILNKGSFTYYVITKGEGVSEWLRLNVIFALSNAEFDYGGLETDKKWLRNMWTAPNEYYNYSI